jgi:hypothetical protein
MNTAPAEPVSLISKQLCVCGCEQTFRPRRPGQRYAYNHKPLELRARPAALRRLLPATPPTNGGVREGEKRSTLDYKIAMRTAVIEREAIEKEIDAIDDELEVARQRVRDLEAKHADKTLRHLTLVTMTELLGAAISDVIPAALLEASAAASAV